MCIYDIKGQAPEFTQNLLSHSADIVRVLAIACGVSGDNLSGFIHQLAEGRDGLSLVYMYHTDSMKTGTSYQNNAHIHLRDNSEVSNMEYQTLYVYMYTMK